MCRRAAYIASALDRNPEAREGSVVAGRQNAALFLSALNFTLALVSLALVSDGRQDTCEFYLRNYY